MGLVENMDFQNSVAQPIDLKEKYMQVIPMIDYIYGKGFKYNWVNVAFFLFCGSNHPSH